jgi:predicted  nucleic acid-binding Zn-ribbon protein
VDRRDRGISTDTPAPASGARRLLELQELDLSVDRLRARLQTLEIGEEVMAARDRTAASESRLGELRLSLDATAREQRRLEGDLDSLQQKMDAERKRLYDGSVANAKELQAIEAEVANLRGRRSRLEDLLLEQMEQREGLEAQVGPLEARVAEARATLAELESTSSGELVETERSLAVRERDRAVLAPTFDPDVLHLYEDLRRQKKGIGAAALVHGICQGCHQQLSPVYLDRLKRTDGIWRCEHCRRILVPT